MGIVLFWVYDTSEQQQRTRELVDRVVPIVERALRLTRLPVVRGMVEDVIDLLGAIRS